MTDMKQPEATPQNLYQITGNVADVNTVLIERAELHRLQAENSGLLALASGGIDLFERYSTFKAKCAELEAMLDAVVGVAGPAFHAAHQHHAQHRSQHHKGRNLHPTRRGLAGGGGAGVAKATTTARPARPRQTAERSANGEQYLEPLMPDIIR